ncbi:c-type cytochrome [Roseobacter weihaiensis]|uniref:c-type cytochrome n=1 Tax=Roseobacter weihaiensis TaxID=2763262 RepID=UPI001D0AFB5C|nr:c-type cytochrome [Roseobacter sp. H9]
MTRTFAAILAMTFAAAPAFAQGDAVSGDPEAGERVFNRCAACHMVVDGDGNTLAGRSGRVGPNLYNITNKAMGSVEDFNYSDLSMAANSQDIRITEETFAAYLADPTGWLEEQTGEDGRSNMARQRVSDEDAVNLFAYLASLASAPDS